MLRLIVLAGLYGLGFVLLGAGLALGGSALSRGALPHVWVWGLALAGGVFLIRALELTRRFGDPSAWRRRRHTPRSLMVAGIGFGCIVIAAVTGGHTAFGHAAIVLGGLLLIVAELQKRPG